MSDPFRPDTKSQLLREAQIGLSVVAILLAVLVYVAFYRLTGRGQHLPDHVRDAPVAQLVWPQNQSPNRPPSFQPLRQQSVQPFAKITPPSRLPGASEIDRQTFAGNFRATQPSGLPAGGSAYAARGSSAMSETKTTRPSVPLVSPNFSPRKISASQLDATHTKAISKTEFPRLPETKRAEFTAFPKISGTETSNPRIPNLENSKSATSKSAISIPEIADFNISDSINVSPENSDNKIAESNAADAPLRKSPIAASPEESNLTKLKQAFGPLEKSLDRLGPASPDESKPIVGSFNEAEQGGVQLASMESVASSLQVATSDNGFVSNDQSFKPLTSRIEKPLPVTAAEEIEVAINVDDASSSNVIAEPNRPVLTPSVPLAEAKPLDAGPLAAQPFESAPFSSKPFTPPTIKPLRVPAENGFVPNGLRSEASTETSSTEFSPTQSSPTKFSPNEPMSSSVESSAKVETRPASFPPSPDAMKRPVVNPETSAGSKPLNAFRAPGSQFVQVDNERQNGFVEVGTKTKQALKYVVQPGDSFLTIADKVYGDTRYFRALYKYNEPTVPDFDLLKAGTVIGTPLPADLAKLWKDLCPPSESSSNSKDSAYVSKVNPIGTRFYVTRSGDTLFGIALENLDQASRYTEILKLNRGVLNSEISNSLPLAPGLRLVLPVE